MILKTGTTLLSLSLLLLLNSCFAAKNSRTLLFESKQYHWKIWYVKEHHFPAGKRNYYEVFYKDKKLVLPPELTGGVAAVSQLMAASGYEAGETYYKSVLLVFESRILKEDGFEERVIVTLRASPALNNNDLDLVNVCNNHVVQISMGQ